MTTARPCSAPPALAGLGSHGSRASARTLLMAAALLLAAAFAGLAPAGARAADGFATTAALGGGAGGTAENPHVLTSRAPHVLSTPEGTSYAAWLAPGEAGGFNAVLATRPPSGSWSTQTIAPALKVSGGVPLGISSNGTLTALVVDPTTSILTALTRPAGSAVFGNAVGISPAGRIAWPTLAVNASGAAVAGYRISPDAGGSIWLAVAAHRTTSGVWDSFAGLRPDEWTNAWPNNGYSQLPTPTFAAGTPGGAVSWADIDPVTVAINDSGKYLAGVALPNASTGGLMRAYVFISNTSGQLSRTMVTDAVNSTFQANRVQVAISSTGAMAFSWLQASLSGSPYEANTLWAGSLSAGSSTIARGSLPGMVPSPVAVAFDVQDRYSLLWTNASAQLFGRVWTARAQAGSLDFDGPTLLSPSADAVWGPSLAVDTTGRRLATWANPTNSTVQARLSLPGSATFSETRSTGTLGSGFPAGPQAAFDGEGNAAVAWLYGASGSAPVQAAGFDTVAPTLGDVLIPSSGTATVPLAFSASTSDRWSTPKLAWSFGDGATADGNQASHTFGAPNSYTATVTATDDVGNSTTRTATVAVASKPVVLTDADNDGVFSDRDCNDDDARVKPTAHDVPGNKVDENCDGKDAAYGVLATTVGYDFSQLRDRLQLKALVVRAVRVGDRIKVRCSGAGCSRKPNVERRVKTVTKKAEYDLLDLVKSLHLRPGAKLTIAVSRDEFTTRIWTLTVRSGKKPSQAITCQLPGTKTTVACS